nr:unnamed protein product [Callosobruchus analis]
MIQVEHSNRNKQARIPSVISAQVVPLLYKLTTYRANDEGKLTTLVFLGYFKAFDTLNHRLVLSILRYGSILGPLLFSINTSRLELSVFSCQQHFYANDVQIFLSFLPDVKFYLDSLYESSLKHCLKLNSLKSSVIQIADCIL